MYSSKKSDDKVNFLERHNDRRKSVKIATKCELKLVSE